MTQFDFDPNEAYCSEGCGQLAVSERATGDFDIVELVCEDHRGDC